MTLQKNRTRAFTEDEPRSDSDGSLDIVKSSRSAPDITKLIEELTQSQKEENIVSEETEGDVEAEDDSFENEVPGYRRPRLYHSTNGPRERVPNHHTQGKQRHREEQAKMSNSDYDLSDEGAYDEFKNSKAVKRKRAAAETKRIREAKKSRAAAATNIVGRKPLRKKDSTLEASFKPNQFASSAEGETEGPETYLDEPVPDYIEDRKKHLRKLCEAGLRFPPTYDDIDLTELEHEEKPVLHRDVKPQRLKQDIKLRYDGGITGGVVPAPIAQWLRDYQVEGVKFLHEKFVYQTGAILGDDMGLGKTIQVIAFLTAAFGKSGTRSDNKLMRKVRRIGDDRWYPRILIVCPGTLMRNWEDELEKWGWWTVYKYHGSPSERQAVIEGARRGMMEIMITTYHTYRNNESQINTIDWDCCIADECHTIKSKDAEITKAMNKVNALCRIGLTGTAIQNKYEELWNLLNWARPGAYGSAQSWRQLISTPLKIGQAHDASYAQLASARSKAKELVEGILPSVFLRRLKALIADQLPKKTDRVVFCQLTDTQAEAYQTLVESERYEYIRRAYEPCDCNSGKMRGWCCYIEVPGTNGTKWASFTFPCMVTLQKLANHLALLLPVTSDLAEKQEKDLDTLQLACPEKWKDLFRIRDNILRLSDREFCGKWKVLKRLLDFWHSNGDKVLVFSHSVRLLRLLKGLFDLDGTKYNFSYLDGSMPYEERSKAVADFNSNTSQFVFLISTKAGGVGLNITSANKVVVVDPNWNPAYDLQAQDRAYRIGQTRDVEVFRLISSGTIEEIIYARQIYKQQQANIGYTASAERRYFKGVMDESSKKGELFGLANLFTFEENGYLLRDIVHKTNVAETRAGVAALPFDPSFQDEDEMDSDDELESVLSNKSLGLGEDDERENSRMKKFADFISSGKKKGWSKKGSNPVNAILAKAGVQYTHENSEVIGRSKVEVELGRKAMEVRNDIEMGSKRVFQFSQSQSQSQRGAEVEDPVYSDDENEDDDDNARGIEGRKREGGLTVNYRYRPDESVRKRQLCEMARMMGYEDPVEFALMVEESTSEGRRKMLERFYRRRRRHLQEEFKRS